MPYIELKTNGKIADRETLKKELGRDIAIIPGKSERWLMVNIEDGCDMCFGGSNEPCAIVTVEIFGGADDETYAKLTAKLCLDVTKFTGIPKDRVYVKYAEVEHWGWNGGNF